MLSRVSSAELTEWIAYLHAVDEERAEAAKDADDGK